MSPWSELIRTLTNELPLLDSLIQVAERKRDALVQDDLAQIEAAVAEETTLIMRLQAQEQALVRVFTELYPLVQSDQLPDLIASPRCPCPEELEQLYQQLLGLLAALKVINQQNQALISQSQAYITLSVKAMTGSQSNQGYTAQGKQAQSNPKRHLDFRA